MRRAEKEEKRQKREDNTVNIKKRKDQDLETLLVFPNIEKKGDLGNVQQRALGGGKGLIKSDWQLASVKRRRSCCCRRGGGERTVKFRPLATSGREWRRPVAYKEPLGSFD